ncbi:MAG TPA: RdgB/HAM1 family non-canonical purine NTP pyrophosphatase [Actinomycetota bacterium]|nr:RdgB/HAM1 family non-canonical purine NTP pyrophosphatase [Actinomycetota bacterium]
MSGAEGGLRFPERILLATRNPGKISEIRRICSDWPVRWLTHEDVRWPDVEETETTYLDNALLKARAAAEATGQPALADDSGIEVDALGGAPGPRSARFAGPDASDEENLRALIRAVAGIPRGGRTARYRAIAAVVWPDGREVWTEGVCEGSLETKPRGTGGFGYDPIFMPGGDDRTMAQLSAAEKDRISHRGRALRALGERLAGRA